MPRRRDSQGEALEMEPEAPHPERGTLERTAGRCERGRATCVNETALREGMRVSQGNDLLISESGRASQGEGVVPTCAGHIGCKSENATPLWC